MMSAKNHPQIILNPLAPKEQEDFLRRCDKLYLALLEKNTSSEILLQNLTTLTDDKNEF